MKDNIFLRAAAYLLAMVIASLSLLAGTTAKYVASATNAASAKVAKFSFVTNSMPFASQGTVDKQLVVQPGQSASNEFTIPLFDTAYYTPADFAGVFTGPGTPIETVTSSNGDAVVAPGTGILIGPGKNNPNLIADHFFPGIYSLQFRNDSEVTVRFKISVDTDESVLHGAPIGVYSDSNGGWGAASNGYILADWQILAPKNTTYCDLAYSFAWPFDSVDDADYYGPDGVAWRDGFGFVLSDPADSRLGMLAAQHLRGEGPTRDNVTLKLVLKLEVEQVN